MYWEDTNMYALEAVKRFLKVRSDLPIMFISSNFAAAGEKLYYVYLEDTKLTQWYKNIKFRQNGVFRIIVTEEFLKDQTNSIDLAAKIPSSFEPEKKVILRIAYAILVGWQRAVIEAYKVAEKDHNKITYNNAMAWYGDLN